MALKFTKKQWMTCIVLAMGNLFNSICISLQAPFYPMEAELKGATPSQYGFVFGIYELVLFILAPIFGKYIDQIGAKFLFNAGILLASIATLLFATLIMIPGPTLFLVFSFLFRILEAVGNTGFMTASFAITAKQFPDNVATIFATMETVYGIGLFLGPLIGGTLYELDGFYLPFTVVGVLLLLTAVVTNLILPPTPPTVCDTKKNAKMFDVIKIPDIIISCSGLIATSMTYGFLNATLEPHMRQFNLSPVDVGSLFVLHGGIYAVSTPVVGVLIDKVMSPKLCAFIGCGFGAVAFCLFGPAPFLPFDTTYWMVIVALVLNGISFAALFVSCFINALKASIKHGLPDNISTYGLISGLFTSTFALGAFVGPSAGGILYDNVGFRNGSYFIIGTQVIVGIMFATLMISKKISRPIAVIS